MELYVVLTGTKKYISVIAASVDNLSLNASEKNRAAAGCIHLAIGHHAAIALLVENQHFGSAAALVRPQFEAFLRGAWLRHCASDLVVNEFLDDKNPPSPDTMIKELEQIDDYKSLVLSLFKKKMWDALCSYTHAGGLHITRRISATEIIQNYSPEEIINMLEISNLLALYLAAEISGLTQNQNAGNKIYAAYLELTGQLEI
jgi:hypothetical protein